jgi:signal transduction histidine kinase
MSETHVESEVFVGQGEMAELCRALDWAATPLGAVATWPQSLRATVSTLLACRNPMFLWWGPELIQFYNDAYRPSFGASGRHPRALGMRGRECWTDIWDTIGPQIEGVMTRGEGVWFEDLYLPIERNGRTEDVWWTYSYSPVRDDDGSINGTLVVCLETTARVVAERQLKQLNRELEIERSRLAYAFMQAPSFLAIYRGPEHRFEFVNEAIYQLVGRRNLIGKGFLEALPELADQGFKELLDGVLRTGEPFIGREVPVTLQRAPGRAPEERFVDFVYKAITEADGMRSGVVAHGHDVTEYVHARREVDAARREAERANRAKSEFLAVMSHELRTPLNAIDGYAELLELGVRGPVNAEQRLDLGRIRKSQRHLLGLINGVLNYARVEAGAVNYEVEPVRVVDALATCEALTAPQMRARGLNFSRRECDPAITVFADIEKLEQMLINLLTNAMRFTDRGGRVTMACTATDDMVAITVEDTGVGIAANHLDRVFEPFVQVDSGLTRTRGGVGLGLAISRDLAHGMGGDLTLQSTVGVGSTFTLTLPRAE